METVLFGQSQLNVKYGTLRTRLSIACSVYQVRDVGQNGIRRSVADKRKKEELILCQSVPDPDP
jgi:hypothetical protein